MESVDITCLRQINYFYIFLIQRRKLFKKQIKCIKLVLLLNKKNLRSNTVYYTKNLFLFSFSLYIYKLIFSTHNYLSLINGFIIESKVGEEEIKLMAVCDRLCHTVDSLRFEHIVLVRFYYFFTSFRYSIKQIFIVCTTFK